MKLQIWFNCVKINYTKIFFNIKMINSLTLSSVCAIVYFIVRFLEMRFVKKDSSRDLKSLFRDSIFVLISVYLSYFLIGQIYNTNINIKKGGSVTPAFTDNPNF